MGQYICIADEEGNTIEISGELSDRDVSDISSILTFMQVKVSAPQALYNVISMWRNKDLAYKSSMTFISKDGGEPREGTCRDLFEEEQ